MLATYLPLPAFVLLGDIPPAPAVLPDGVPPWLAYLFPALGLFLLSTCVAALNEVIRQRDASGVPVSPRLRLVASILNVVAANHDKAREQRAIASGAEQPRPAPEAKP